MSFFDLFQQAPAKHFPNGLLESEAKVVAPRWGLVICLALVCFAPRAWIAFHWDLVWTDSVTFLNAAKAIEHGDLHQAFEETGINVYPVILYAARRLGIPWTLAGTWWSVLMGTAAVLPLFGWVRRQFNDQVAIVACLAYAFHGKLMAVSVLIIRDPTFWFLFNLTLYLLWRAVTENRWRWFAAAGLSLTMAIHTRSEGCLLVIPLALWPAFRWPAVVGHRRTLVGGAVLCLATVPLCMAIVNLTWLRDAPRWSPIREAHLEILHRWIESAPAQPTAVDGSSPRPAAAASQVVQERPSLSPETDPMSFSPDPLPKKLRKLGETLVKAYTYLLGLFALIGVVRWRHVYLRRDHQTLLLMVVALLAMIAIRNTQVRGDIRYFFPMVLVSLPWIALGFLQISEWLLWLTTWGRSPSAVRPWITLVLAAGLVFYGMLDTNLSSTGFMREHTQLGKWIRRNFGPDRTFAANIIETRLVQYHSGGRMVGYVDPRSCNRHDLPQELRNSRPDMLLFWCDPMSRDLWRRYARSITMDRDLGYRIVPEQGLPRVPDEVIVLVRVPRIQ